MDRNNINKLLGESCDYDFIVFDAKGGYVVAYKPKDGNTIVDHPIEAVESLIIERDFWKSAARPGLLKRLWKAITNKK
jgi:hypothetical protein